MLVPEAKASAALIAYLASRVLVTNPVKSPDVGVTSFPARPACSKPTPLTAKPPVAKDPSTVPPISAPSEWRP